MSNLPQGKLDENNNTKELLEQRIKLADVTVVVTGNKYNVGDAYLITRAEEISVANAFENWNDGMPGVECLIRFPVTNELQTSITIGQKIQIVAEIISHDYHLDSIGTIDDEYSTDGDGQLWQDIYPTKIEWTMPLGYNPFLGHSKDVVITTAPKRRQ